MKKLLTVCAACCLLAVILAAILIWHYLFLPIERPGRELVVRIESGQTLSRIAWDLKEKEVIATPRLFVWLGRISGRSTGIQAGEFKINSGWSRWRLLEHLHSGTAILHKLQVPEGLTWWEIGALVEEAGLASQEAFAEQVSNQRLLKAHNIPASTAEGFLFPETYFFHKQNDGNAKQIVERMLEEFWQAVDGSIWTGSRPDKDRVLQLVTLASLVEKETGLPEERRTIAGVFTNRLERGMRLQCDPTVIYGLGRSFDGNLRKRDLRDEGNPYNTYAHSGLPPGPICSPGLASLKAAADPAEHDYLYFVATGDGGHHFSRTLTEHNRAVRKYQLQ
jgi:UPF0755 protein